MYYKALFSVIVAAIALWGPRPTVREQAIDPAEDITLIAHYPLTGDALDQQRNHFHGEIINGVTFEYDQSLKKQVAVFAGGQKGAQTGSAIRLPVNLLNSVKERQTITVATWVYYTPQAPPQTVAGQTGQAAMGVARNANRTRIFDFGQDQHVRFFMTTRHNLTDNYAACYVPNGSGSERAAGTEDILPPSSWQHCAVTVSGFNGALTLYLNGVAVDKNTISGGLATALGISPGNLVNGYFIGRSNSPTGASEFDFQGKMSDFKIFDRPLSGLEMRELYDSYFDDETIVNSVYNNAIADLGALTQRTDNFTFPSVMSQSGLNWTSSNTALVTNSGAIIRPPNTNPNQAEPATITLTVRKGQAVKSGNINVSVLRLPNDGDIVANDLAQLPIDLGPVITNMDLPAVGQMGSRITWASSAPSIISPSGIIARPEIGKGNATATLTATARSGSASLTKKFDIAVAQLTSTLELIGVEDISFVSPIYHIPDLPYYVDGKYTLGKKGPKVRVLWTTSSRVAIPPSTEYTSPPTTAEDYAKPGIYTIKGRVPGTNYVSTATVTVVDEKSSLLDKVEHVVDSSSVRLEMSKHLGFTKESRGLDIEYKSRVYRVASVQNKTRNSMEVAVSVSLNDGDRVVASKDERLSIPANGKATVEIASPNAATSNAGLTVKANVLNAANQRPLAACNYFSGKGEAAENLNIADSMLPRPEIVLAKFSLSDVVLNPAEDGTQTVFQRGQDRMIAALANTNVNNFLWVFRDAFGIDQPEGTVMLAGWDNRGSKLRGHASGHYMSAISQAYLSTKAYDQRLANNFLNKMNTMIGELREMQLMCKGNPVAVPMGPGKTVYDSDFTVEGIRHDYENWGDGFISGYPPDQFIMLEHGAPYVNTQPYGIWAPYYTLHKILAGCLDIYTATGNKDALDVAAGMGRWVTSRLKALPARTLNTMWASYIAGEYGGMNETLAHLHALTRDPIFLEGAKLFDNNPMFFGWHSTLNPGDNFDRRRGLATNVDTMRTLHSNQHLPQIMGALITYEQSLDTKYFDIVNHFWKKLYNSYTYSYGGTAGGLANSECFTAQPDWTFGMGGLPAVGNRDVGESCATYNINKITQRMFMHKGDPLYMDYYERNLYNHTLAAINTTDAGTSYHNPLVGGWQQSYGNPDLTGFSCCGGSGLEQHTKYQDSIFMHRGDKELYVNLYIPSTLTWGNLKVAMATNYPNGDSIKLHVIGSRAFDMKLRIPHWATKGFTLKVNGQTQEIEAPPSSYVTLSRNWRTGDVVELIMPMGFHLFETTNATHIASVFYGPVLLAGTETERFEEGNYRPIALNGDNLDASFERTANASPYSRNLTFTSNGRTLKPMYDFGRERRMPYWNVTKVKE